MLDLCRPDLAPGSTHMHMHDDLLAAVRGAVGSRVQYCLEQASVVDMHREGVAQLIGLYGKLASPEAGQQPHSLVLITWLRDALATGARYLTVNVHIVAPLLRLVVAHVGKEGASGSEGEAAINVTHKFRTHVREEVPPAAAVQLLLLNPHSIAIRSLGAQLLRRLMPTEVQPKTESEATVGNDNDSEEGAKVLVAS